MTGELKLAVHQPSLPSIVKAAGHNAQFAWDEFFYGRIRSSHTRRAYCRAVMAFLQWCDEADLRLTHISPAHVGLYLDRLRVSIASKKQVLAALRHFFDGMVYRHAIPLNPALSVRTERYSVVEGKTPEVTVADARRLLASIDDSDIVGMRDKCIVSILIYTAARVGAVANLKTQDFYEDADQFKLHFLDKGNKSREIPVRHDLQLLLLSYLKLRAELGCTGSPDLFCTAIRRARQLTNRRMSANDISRMLKRRLAHASLPKRLSAHSFRVGTITDLLTQGVPLEDVQQLAGHSDPRTTKLYDRRSKSVSRNIVERISV